MIAVWLVTGFLGSGKTTLLREVLSSNAGATGVIVNEIGAIGIDQLLLEEVVPGTVLLPNGCLCCTAAEGLVESLDNLIRLSSSGEAHALERIIIETTGMADPRPVVASLMQYCHQHADLNFDGVITLIDCVNAKTQRSAQPEWIPQVLAADILVLSKTDQVSSDRAQGVAGIVAALNPLARIVDKQAQDCVTSLFLNPSDPRGTNGPAAGPLIFSATKHAQVKTYSIAIEEPVDWMRFSVWVMLAVRKHGEKLLRIKAVIWQDDDPVPVLLQAVQHLVYPPVHMERLRGSPRVSSVVLICRGLESEYVVRSLYGFLGLSQRS